MEDYLKKLSRFPDFALVSPAVITSMCSTCFPVLPPDEPHLCLIFILAVVGFVSVVSV